MHSHFPGKKGNGDNKELEGIVSIYLVFMTEDLISHNHSEKKWQKVERN